MPRMQDFEEAGEVLGKIYLKNKKHVDKTIKYTCIVAIVVIGIKFFLM